MKLEDKDKMPFGKHNDKQMADVPAGYLFWLEDGIKKKKESSRNATELALLVYIEENRDALNKEIKRERREI